MPQCSCGRFYSTTNYDPDRGDDLCPQCHSISTGYSYVSREYVGQDVTNSSSWINDSTNKQDTYHE